MAGVRFLVALFIATAVAAAGAQVVHHVVADGRTSDTSTDVGPWSSGRVFRVGDSLLFHYFSPQETIVELASMEEYYSCDLSNPIRMYADRANTIPLEREGIRYFASGSTHLCKNGFKLPVHIKPQDEVATGPSPSSSTRFNGLSCLVVIGLFVYGLYFF